MFFCVAGAGVSTPCQKGAKREGFVAVPKTMAGAVQEICSSSDMLRCQCADFLRGVAFWSIRSVGLLR